MNSTHVHPDYDILIVIALKFSSRPSTVLELLAGVFALSLLLHKSCKCYL